MKRVLPKSEACASYFRGVNGRSKFSRSFFLSPFFWPQGVPFAVDVADAAVVAMAKIFGQGVAADGRSEYLTRAIRRRRGAAAAIPQSVRNQCGSPGSARRLRKISL